jgi:phospholipid-binding lipoprotein MlaA
VKTIVRSAGLLALAFLLVAASAAGNGPGALALADDTGVSEEESDDWEEAFEDWEDEGAEVVPAVPDPIEPWNRAMFHVNDKLYFWVLKPVAQGYRYVVPEVVRRGVNNFFTNITAPIRIVNSALQGKGDRTSIEAGRFVINLIEGGLGFGNAADNYPELASSPEDFGQTLGYWGVGNGFFIIWPVLGPSTFRDSVGLVGDYFLHPVTYVEPMELRLGIRGYEIVNRTSLRIGDYEALKAAAISPYDALKDAYLQNRHQLVNR